MKIIRAKDYADMSRKAAAIIAAQPAAAAMHAAVFPGYTLHSVASICITQSLLLPS